MKRPTLNKDNFDENHPSYQDVLKDFLAWGKDISEENKECIKECFLHYNHDGYRLARMLEDYYYIEPDEKLVEILSQVFIKRRNMERDLEKEWVKENQLSFAGETSKQVSYNGKNYFIRRLYDDEYKVGISENIEDKLFRIVGAEEVIFIK